jgi:hypothetical protein
MKTILLSFAIFLIFTFQSFGQINPITNLTWNHYYEQPNNYFILEWEEPDLPHDELIGYNVYREDELFIFINETSIYNIYDPVYGIVSNCGGEEFLFYSTGGFTAYVTAVYNPEQIESTPEAIEIDEPLLIINYIKKPKAILYPNPTNGILNIGNKNLTKIQLFDLTGKILKEFNPNPLVDLSNFSKGIYLIKLISDEGIMTDKIIIK